MNKTKYQVHGWDGTTSPFFENRELAVSYTKNYLKDWQNPDDHLAWYHLPHQVAETEKPNKCVVVASDGEDTDALAVIKIYDIQDEPRSTTKLYKSNRSGRFFTEKNPNEYVGTTGRSYPACFFANGELDFVLEGSLGEIRAYINTITNPFGKQRIIQNLYPKFKTSDFFMVARDRENAEDALRYLGLGFVGESQALDEEQPQQRANYILYCGGKPVWAMFYELSEPDDRGQRWGYWDVYSLFRR